MKNRFDSPDCIAAEAARLCQKARSHQARQPAAADARAPDCCDPVPEPLSVGAAVAVVVVAAAACNGPFVPRDFAPSLARRYSWGSLEAS